MCGSAFSGCLRVHFQGVRALLMTRGCPFSVWECPFWGVGVIFQDLKFPFKGIRVPFQGVRVWTCEFLYRYCIVVSGHGGAFRFVEVPSKVLEVPFQGVVAAFQDV